MIKNIVLTVLSAILLAVSFPKANLFPLAWIGLIPFLFVVKNSKTPISSFWNGFLLGAVFFSIDLAWLTTLSDYAGGWAILGYVCLVIYQALYFGAAAWIIKLAFNFSPLISIVAVPGIWILFEWLRTLGPFGVAAGGLGYSQALAPELIQLASLTLVYGVSFLIVFINLSIVYAFENRKNLKRSAVIISSILIVFGGNYLYGTSCLKTKSGFSKTARVAVIQANIDQKTKMDPASTYSSFERHDNLSRQAASQNPKIIIWSETAVPAYLLENSALLKRAEAIARQNSIYLLVGTPSTGQPDKIYNSLVAFSPEGEMIGIYNKQHPVPFGEYLPFRALLYPFMKGLNFFKYDFDADPCPKLIQLDDLNIGVLICFESTFPFLARQRAAQGADILLTVTNDAWFKDSSALEKHLNMGILRAVENRKYFIQAANTGISAVIDPRGRILRKSNINRTEILTFEISRP